MFFAVKFWKEFKEFAFKGNVISLAVGVVIGNAFGKITTSLVNDIIMPIFGWMTAGMQFSSLKWVLSPAVTDEAGNVVTAEAAIAYGSFIQNVVDFLIIAFCIFLAVRMMNKAAAAAAAAAEKLHLNKKEEEAKETVPEAPAEPPAPPAPTEAELLAEIRDLLKAQKESREGQQEAPRKEGIADA
ncbi:MAG TPA: large conductance mechanosensitive channel protein MscL [Candidatus Merdivicinus faecavium]|nr:large conductance mechanosensitive channel protein MscL [Candidatus Merdivicinus faecavium]